MSALPTSGEVIRRHTAAGFTDLGVVLHVEKDRGLFWWIPFPSRNVKGNRYKHHIPAPRAWCGDELAQPDGSVSTSYVPYRAPALQAMSECQIKELAEKSTPGDRRNLLRSLEIMNEQWALIETLVKRCSVVELLNRDTVNAFATNAATKDNLVNKAKRAAIVRAVRAYLMGGCKKEALIPRWDRCNVPGKEKLPRPDKSGNFSRRPGRKNIAQINGHPEEQGIVLTETDRKKLADGWKKYKVSKAESVESAYYLTLAEYWSGGCEYTSKGRKVHLKPLRELPTLAQFRRHGPAMQAERSATRINLGEHRYQRNERPLKGTARDGIAAACQVGWIDSTPEDQNLVLMADRTVLLPTPHNTKVLEGYTDYILGIYSGFERPSTMTALMAIAHAAESKVEYCKRYGIDITDDEWLFVLPRLIRGDNGEHKSEEGIKSLTEAQIALEFVRAYAAEQKGPVEASHFSIARQSSHRMAGSTMGEQRQRGDVDPARNACLTHEEYMPHLIRAVMFHNNHERVEHLLTVEMRAAGVKPHRGDILRWMIAQGYVATTSEDLDSIRVRCLPTVDAVIRRDGVHVFDPRSGEERLIKHMVFSSQALHDTGLTDRGRSTSARCKLHLNPSNLSKAWVRSNGLVPVVLQTHDPLADQMTLLEWLTISDSDRLARYFDQHKELEIRAADGEAIWTTNAQAKRAKRDQLADSTAPKQTTPPSKREALNDVLEGQKRWRLGLNAANAPVMSASGQALESTDAAEDDWIALARASVSTGT